MAISPGIKEVPTNHNTLSQAREAKIASITLLPSNHSPTDPTSQKTTTRGTLDSQRMAPYVVIPTVYP